jgi:membrane fusion protein, multidrug efflux system
MKKLYILILMLGIAAACSNNEGSSTSDVQEKKKELEEARKEQQALKEKINQLEKEIASLDPEYANEANKAILVSTFVPAKRPFEHKVDVRGSVASRKNVLISAQIPGIIEKVHVREGQRVQKGQVLVALDAAVIRHNIKELKTALELANTIFEKQSRLWQQKIGTEVQYLEAKNRKESLESQLATTQAQLDQSIIRAPFNGTIDEVQAREGEMASPGVPVVRITSPEDMYIKADVSERFIGKFSKGDKVDVYFPLQDKRIASTIAAVSEVINPENRTFSVEIVLPKTDFTLKPNQVTVLEIRDYFNREAITVPTRLILKDDSGEYIYGVQGEGKNKVAKKIRVKSGVSYNGRTEILEGLTGNEEIVDKGFRDLAEGVQVAVAPADQVSEVAQK